MTTPVPLSIHAQLDATCALNRIEQGEDTVLSPEHVLIISRMLTGDLGIDYKLTDREVRKIAMILAVSHENLRQQLQ